MAEEFHGGYFTKETGDTLFPEMPNEPIDHDKYIPSSFNYVGKKVERRDGFRKTSGRAMYTKDVTIPGMVYGKFYRSPWPMESSRAWIPVLPGRCPVCSIS
jgi:hypothetical protein